MPRPEPQREPPTPGPKAWRRVGLLLDLLAVGLLVALALAAWPRGAPTEPVAGLENLSPPCWSLGSAADLDLHGPDAGYWAEAIRRVVVEGAVDCHRMPLFILSTALVSLGLHDVVFAGHVVVHLAGAVGVLLVWMLARGIADRGTALAAALLTGLSPALVAAQGSFGVDTVFRTTVLVAALAVWFALRGHPSRGLLAGLGLGLCAGTHYLGLLWPLPACLLLLTVPGTWRQRTLRAGGCLGVTLAVLLLLRPGCGLYSWDQLVGEYAMAIATHKDRWDVAHAGAGPAAGLVLPSLAGSVWRAVPHGLEDMIPGLAHGGWLAPLVGVGLLAPRLRRGLRWEGRTNAWLLLLLLPLVGLEASNAPLRYRQYAGPFLFLLLARGGAVLPWAVDLAVGRRLPRWPRGVLALAAAMALGAAIQAPWRTIWGGSSTRQDLHTRRLAMLILERFPNAPCLLGRAAETLFFADRPACDPGVCAARDAGWAEPVDLSAPVPPQVAACLAHIRNACGQTGSFPYAVEVMGSNGLPEGIAPAMDRWVQAHGEPAGEVRTEDRHSMLFALPCAQGAPTP